MVAGCILQNTLSSFGQPQTHPTIKAGHSSKKTLTQTHCFVNFNWIIYKAKKNPTKIKPEKTFPILPQQECHCNEMTLQCQSGGSNKCCCSLSSEIDALGFRYYFEPAQCPPWLQTPQCPPCWPSPTAPLPVTFPQHPSVKHQLVLLHCLASVSKS